MTPLAIIQTLSKEPPFYKKDFSTSLVTTEPAPAILVVLEPVAPVLAVQETGALG